LLVVAIVQVAAVLAEVKAFFGYYFFAEAVPTGRKSPLIVPR
jgi:hypothetical protein